MAQRPSRSLKHEYELYLEREIENYKESVPRSVLLSIGDDAVRALAAQQQFALTELLLVDEVDKIIFKRLQLPAYVTWRKRRIKLLDELRRPEHWGLSPDDLVVRAIQTTSSDVRVLLAGAQMETPRTALATAWTASKSPGEAAGKPASITSTPRACRTPATWSF